MTGDAAEAPPPPPRRATILARMAGHFRRQDWVAVAVEFAIVVLGVFIGLQASNWNTNLAERRREAGVLSEIAADLRQDRRELAAGRANALGRVAAANYVLQRATGRTVTVMYLPSVRGAVPVPAAPTPDAAARGSLWAIITSGYYPTPSTTAFDSLSGAGELGLIRDAALVREIQSYRLVAANLEATQDNALRPQIIGVREVGEANGLAALAFIDEEKVVKAVAGSPQIAATIESQIGWSVIHVIQIDTTDERAAALLKRLQAAGVR